MIIRQEKPSDFSKIYQLIKLAFETAPVKDGDEQDYVDNLRKSNRYIPELALVAEDNEKLIGHIMLTKMQIVNETKIYEELLLSPISVILEYRNRYIGKSLIERSFEIAKNLGYTAVFLCGDPGYYGRFGFRPTIDFGIANEGNISQQYVMACELQPLALTNKSGLISIV